MSGEAESRMIGFVVHLDGQWGHRDLVVQRQPAIAPLFQTCGDRAIKIRAVWKQMSTHYPCLGPFVLGATISVIACLSVILSIEPGHEIYLQRKKIQ